MRIQLTQIIHFEKFCGHNFCGKGEKQWSCEGFEILLVFCEKRTVSLEMSESNIFANWLATEISGDFQGFFARKLVLERFASGVEIKLKTFHSSISRRVGVFFCGPAVLSHTLHQMSNKHSGSGTRFYYNKENF